MKYNVYWAIKNQSGSFEEPCLDNPISMGLPTLLRYLGTKVSTLNKDMMETKGCQIVGIRIVPERN